MTGKKFRRELEQEYGRRIEEQSLTVWCALTKAKDKYTIIADIVAGAEAPLEAWNILKRIVDDDGSGMTRAKKGEEVLRIKFEQRRVHEGIDRQSEVSNQQCVILLYGSIPTKKLAMEFLMIFHPPMLPINVILR